jgi:hypothetical protein
MFKRKKIVVLLAAAMLVAACGGGGGDNRSTEASGNPQPVDTGGSSNTPPNTPAPGNDQPAVPADPQMRGYLEMVGNQVNYLKDTRDVYWALLLETFEGIGITEAARGSRDGSEPGWIRPPAFAPAAPLASFGIRVNRAYCIRPHRAQRPGGPDGGNHEIGD